MALFKLNDINFNKDQRGITGPLSSLSGTKYEMGSHRYPADIGALDKGHYITFFVNVQKKTQFTSKATTGDRPTIMNNRKLLENMRGSTNLGGNFTNVLDGGTKLASQVKSAVSPALDKLGNLPGVSGIVDKGKSLLGGAQNKAEALFGDAGKNFIESAGNFGQGFTEAMSEAKESLSQGGFARTIKRTSENITLYMPDTLQFDYRQNFADISTNEGLLGTGLAAISAVAENKGDEAALAKNMTAFVGTAAAEALGGPARALAATAFGVVKNPGLELIYSSPEFRNFQFEFRFHPRDENEAREVMNIIDSLRFHQAPEIKEGSGGFLLVPPSEFDIKFYYNGKENPNIDQISTCVMTNLQVNYAPEGFSAYESPGNLNPSKGSTGTPVTITLVMSFKETQIITKETYRPKDGENANAKRNVAQNDTSSYF
tara:strand:+ start:780 stop:2069 length:1290 start_codon:yes stop_codon:yes gene_type:complete